MSGFLRWPGSRTLSTRRKPERRHSVSGEVYYEAVLIGGLDGLTLDHKEVLESRLSGADLPDGMPEADRELADSL